MSNFNSPSHHTALPSDVEMSTLAADLDRSSDDSLRDEFLIPTQEELKYDTLQRDPDNNYNDHSEQGEECTYLCGNSLGLQPKLVNDYVNQHLSLWQQKGVYGHFKHIKDCKIPPWVNFDEALQGPMARIVGALSSEVAVMQTLSTNLHILLGSFYKPTATRNKIMIEEKSFPSDHFVVESQLQHHGVNPTEGLLLLRPPTEDSSLLPTEHILAEIDNYGDSIAVLLLPGIQFYTGQFFDIPRITVHAQNKGITVGWDLAHAVGNVPLSLHDWNVDFAAWCNYKYMNAGPGAIGGLFVHSRHTEHTFDNSDSNGATATHETEAYGSGYRPRLQGWWGSTKASRFAMDNKFTPIAGALGFQLSNPSALDMTALLASLAVFSKTSMTKLRQRSVKLTNYLESLLMSPDLWDARNKVEEAKEQTHAPLPYSIITPRDPNQRGAQLSVRLPPELLDDVMKTLETEGVVVDERKPDVIRVAPAPLYNTYRDCFKFVTVFQRACADAIRKRQNFMDARPS